MNPRPPRAHQRGMAQSILFEPLRVGSLTLPNRLVMAPMTRSRAGVDGVPSPLAADYYRQRSSAGLIITEATQTSPAGQGYARTPGMHNEAQAAAWKTVVDQVHAAGGRIFLQLFHVGRIAHAANRTTAEPPVAPSAIRAQGTVWTDTQGMQPFDEPRALTTAEIAAVAAEFGNATRLAIGAGFDGVELHAASGYLHMQFLSPGANIRTDQYGGSAENRGRFVVETLKVMIAAAGSAAKVGIKISPYMQFNDCADPNPEETYTALVRAIDPLGLAYLHIMRWPGANIAPQLRPLFHGPLLLGGGFDGAAAEAALQAGEADAIVIGKWFVSNPDLVSRVAHGAPLAAPDPSTFYTPGPKGYVDYPALSA